MSGFRIAKEQVGKARQDIVLLGIAFVAMMLFVSTGGVVLPQAMLFVTGEGRAPDPMLTNALLLNIALIMFGWRRYVELSNEVAERRLAEQQANELANTDPLTGCLNRRSINRAADELIARAEQDGRNIAVLVADLDGFKLVNDLNGHTAGDAVLIKAAQRLRETLGDDALVARLGGDEFACIVVFDQGEEHAVSRLAGKIVKRIGEPFKTGHTGFDISVSVGIDVSSRADFSVQDGQSPAEALLHHADIAMYYAKRRGRGGHAMFEPAMENERRFRGEVECGIRQGIHAGEFVPYYQPQIDIGSKELVGFEMLARWNSPRLGLVNPDIFIPIAEEIGAIAELSENLIAQALADAKGWDPSLMLSVNVSPIQLQDQWFAQKLLKLLADAGFPPHRLEIEITESCLHDNIVQVRTVIASLQNQGVKVSLDDFGTGYSSIAQLRSLPFDRLKIDRSFVGDADTDPAELNIIEAILGLARSLNMPVTAEGIETDIVHAHLAKLGDMKGQGYLYGRPANAHETGAFLAAQGLLAGSEGAANQSPFAVKTATEESPSSLQPKRAAS